MASKSTKGEILAKFFDDGEYTALFADGAVSAASGYAAGQQAYAVFQNGEAVSVKDVEKNIKVLELAAQTGCPVVTFYDSVGAKLAEGLDVLNAAAKLNATIAKVSGVVPQVAVVLGVCGGTSALSAANADVCIMAEGAELFFTAPFTAAAKGDKVADAGSAAAAAKAGVAAIVAADAAEAAEKAAHIVGLLPANNLTGPAIFEFEQPTAVLSANAEPAKAAAALIDKDSAVEMYAGFGKNVYTAFATIGGNAVGVVATGKELCHNCVAKASRFVRLCDAFSVPVLTIVNTEGFVPSTSDDIAGGIREAARLAATYADATTAKVALIAGKAVGPVYTALAAADLKIAVKGCTISALEPSAAVSVLYKDEIAQRNGWDYKNDPDRVEDSRNLHRSKFNWEDAKQRTRKGTLQNKLWQGMEQLRQMRADPCFAPDAWVTTWDSHNPGVLALVRKRGEETLVGLFNFTEYPAGASLDALGGEYHTPEGTSVWLADVELEPYQTLLVKTNK